ncbi:hypothetical protein DSO57_1025448 [Entomophthora muscae]|uniref:Uncharacterized protein n=1 Tax=Entomophthora muscae TaxID=34485 RepID=A0ACC2UCA3_9FUNG|nr:hypothetical protein DSO57_1025448 [Entomophthora muscae]
MATADIIVNMGTVAAAMLPGDTLDWSRKATAENVESCLGYSRFEAELMSTGNNQGTRS